MPNALATIVPNLQKNENGAAFAARILLRSYAELYPMLDLYFRAHWATENVRLHGGSSGRINGDIIMERRKALEWLSGATTDWDNVSMGA